jgi:uncharacterized protein (TIGR00369 family)
MISSMAGDRQDSADRGDAIGTAFQRSLGLRWERGSDPGSVVVVMEMRDDLRGPAGSLEGGVVSTLSDVAGASACAMAVGSMVATQHIAISFLAPGRGGPIHATGVVLRTGRADAVSEVRIVDCGNEDRLIAVALVTVRVLRDRT